MVISRDNDRLTIIISKESKRKLKLLAIEDNRSLSNYVANVLESYVSEILNDNEEETNDD